MTCEFLSASIIIFYSTVYQLWIHNNVFSKQYNIKYLYCGTLLFLSLSLYLMNTYTILFTIKETACPHTLYQL